MNHKYIVYPVYGKGKTSGCFRQQTIIGTGKEYNDVQSLWQAIANNMLKFKSDDLLIVDWAHYRFKSIIMDLNLHGINLKLVNLHKIIDGLLHVKNGKLIQKTI